MDTVCRPVLSKSCTSVGQAGYPIQIGKLHFQPHEENSLKTTPRYKYKFNITYSAEELDFYEDTYMTWLRGISKINAAKFQISR